MHEHNPAEFRYRFFSRLGPQVIDNPLPAVEPMWKSWLAGGLLMFAIAVVVVLT